MQLFFFSGELLLFDLLKISFVISSLGMGGIHPKFVIIDDGWQSVAMDPTGIASESENAAK